MCSQVCTRTSFLEAQERQRDQFGNIEAILRSKGVFNIANANVATKPIALQIARNLHQYYAADSAIRESESQIHDEKGNLITVSLGDKFSTPTKGNFPINVGAFSLTIRDDVGVVTEYPRYVGQDIGLGAIFVRPLGDDRLELVVWGVDLKGLEIAARLVPTITGAGQPDFVITTTRCLERGLGGVLAMGFFDSLWNVSKTSYLT